MGVLGGRMGVLGVSLGCPWGVLGCGMGVPGASTGGVGVRPKNPRGSNSKPIRGRKRVARENARKKKFTRAPFRAAPPDLAKNHRYPVTQGRSLIWEAFLFARAKIQSRRALSRAAPPGLAKNHRYPVIKGRSLIWEAFLFAQTKKNRGARSRAPRLLASQRTAIAQPNWFAVLSGRHFYLRGQKYNRGARSRVPHLLASRRTTVTQS